MAIFPLIVVPLMWLVETLIIIAVYIYWYPGRTVVLAVAGAVVLALGPRDAFALAFWTVVLVVAWWLAAWTSGFFRRPKRSWAQWVARWLSWQRWIGSWLRPWWVSRWVYGRRWSEEMQEDYLTIVRPHARDKVPKIRKTIVGPFGHTLHVKMLPGQTVDLYERKAAAFAEAFGAQSCHAYPRYTEPGRIKLPMFVELEDGRRRLAIGKRAGGRRIPGHVTLDFAVKDTLSEPLAPIPVPASADDVDFSAVPVGRTESGERWTLKIHGSHILVAGLTGSGKGSILWSILKGLAPAIQAGTVQVWAIDPKGGMELYRGRPLYHRYCDSTPKAMTVMLNDLVREMNRRTQRYKVATRQHEPTVAEPLILCLIDEFASIMVPVSKAKADKDVADEAKAAATLLVNKGRSVGISLVGALQNPRKEVVDMRDEIPDRIALRLLSAQYTDMMFWQGAAASGIRCDRILRTQPGRGFAWNDDKRAIVAVRAVYVPDEEIVELAEKYSPVTEAERILDEIEKKAAGA